MLLKELLALSEAKAMGNFWKHFVKVTSSHKVVDLGKMNADEINEWAESVDEESPWAIIAAWALGAKNVNEIAYVDTEESGSEHFEEANKVWKAGKVIPQGHQAGYYSPNAMQHGTLDGVKAISVDEMGFSAFVVLKKDLARKA